MPEHYRRWFTTFFTFHIPIHQAHSIATTRHHNQSTYGDFSSTSILPVFAHRHLLRAYLSAMAERSHAEAQYDAGAAQQVCRNCRSVSSSISTVSHSSDRPPRNLGRETCTTTNKFCTTTGASELIVDNPLGDTIVELIQQTIISIKHYENGRPAARDDLQRHLKVLRSHEAQLADQLDNIRRLVRFASEASDRRPKCAEEDNERERRRVDKELMRVSEGLNLVEGAKRRAPTEGSYPRCRS